MLDELCPPGITLELIDVHGAAPGVVVSLDSPYMAAASRAIEHGFGRAPVFIREGGSIPVVTTFREQLGVDTLLLGLGPGRRQHAQPEREVFPRRLSPRNQGERAIVAGVGKET